MPATTEYLPSNSPDGKPYEVVLCGNVANVTIAEDGTEKLEKCNRQVDRSFGGDWSCDLHGRCTVVRFAEVTCPIKVVLG